MDWVNEVLGNKKLIRNIITASVWLSVILLGLFYFLFIANATWDWFYLQKLSLLTIIFAISIYALRKDAKYRGFDDENDENKELIETKEHIIENRIKIEDVDIGLQFLIFYNDKQRELANNEKTEAKINKLRDKISKQIQRDKDFSQLNEEIKRLQEYPLHNKKFTPIRMSDIINVYSDKNGQSYIDRKSIYSNPKNKGDKTSFIGILLRSVVGGGVGFGLALSDDLKTMVAYFALLLTMGTYTYMSNYVWTRKDTQTEYLDKQKNRLGVMKEMNTFITREKVQSNN